MGCYILQSGTFKTTLITDQLNAQKSCFIISFLYASTCFEHYVLIVRRSKLYYTASGIVTPVGGRPVHRLRQEAYNKLIIKQGFVHYVG